jgi:hypothetical protein
MNYSLIGNVPLLDRRVVDREWSMEVGNGFDPESATGNVVPQKYHTFFRSGSIGF